jgi:rubrerythrin
MAGNLSQKERTIIQDQMRHEEVCIAKYNDYARRASNATLRRLFNELAQEEEQHYQTLNGLMGGSGNQPQGQSGGTGMSGVGTSRQTGGSTRGGLSNMSEQEFIQQAAEQRLQGRTQQHVMPGEEALTQPGWTQQIGQQGGQQGGPQLGWSQQMGQQSQQYQQPQQLQRQGSQQQLQQGQQNRQSQQFGGQQPLQEASRELIPMFRTEAAQELMGSASGTDESSSLRDMLMTEQFVSGSYDSAIFDSISPNVRQALQHIQKDEQKHGQRLREYMQSTGQSQ